MSGLKWRISPQSELPWKDIRAQYTVCGLRAVVIENDRSTYWWIGTIVRGPKLAEGTRPIGHFDDCLHDAEVALRRIVADRIADLRATRPNPHASEPQP